jgi:Ca2+-binding EF-hand superfamily protein
MVTLRTKKLFLEGEHQIEEALSLADYDEDGKIGVEDLYSLFFELGEPMDKEDVEEMIKYASSSYDGYCSKKDFFKLMAKESVILE